MAKHSKKKYLEEARADLVVDPDDGLSPTFFVGKVVDLLYQNSLGLAGRWYDQICLGTRVFSSFRGSISDRALVDLYAKSKDELCSYALDAAGMRA